MAVFSSEWAIFLVVSIFQSTVLLASIFQSILLLSSIFESTVLLASIFQSKVLLGSISSAWAIFRGMRCEALPASLYVNTVRADSAFMIKNANSTFHGQ